MNTTTKVLIFGFVSGLIWSGTIPMLEGGFDSVGEAAGMLVPGVLSGVLVSLALRSPLSKFGRTGAFIAGLLSLPLGAFLFGFFATIMEIFVRGKSAGNFKGDPLLGGLACAGLSVTMFYFVLPPAIITTFILRAVILSGRRDKNVA